MTDTVDDSPAADAPLILEGDGRLLDPLVRRWTAIGAGFAVAGFWLLGTLGRVTNLFADPHAVTARFFDIQADALMHGRLSVPRGSLYIEEFVTPHGSYMYFGVFPALLRVPIRLVFSGLDNRLTLFSCLLAMAVIAVSTARLARRAQRQLGLAGGGEYTPSYRWFALIAAAPVLLTPVLFLASRSMVYHEAIAWGAAGALWGIDAALQWWYCRRPRDLVLMTLAAAVAINSRPSVGLAPTFILLMFAALLVVRRHWRPAAASAGAAFIAIATYSAVDYGRFRQLFGAPAQYQVSYGEFANQRAAAALTNNSLFSLRFIPSGVARYFNPSPNFMRITRLFPFVKFGDRAAAVGHVPMQLEYSGSIFTAAPALVMFAVVGAVWIVRRGGTAWRVAALGGSLAALTTLGFWAIWHRYLVNFVPVLVVLAVPGLWLVLDAARTRVRWQRAVVGTGVAAVMLLGLVGQVGLSLWSRFFEFLPYHQEQLDATRLRYRLDDELFGGTPPGVHLVDADTPRDALPPADIGDVLIAGKCDGLYIGGFGWQALTLRSGSDRRAVAVAPPALMDALQSDTVPLAAGDGWHLETRPFLDSGVLALYYVDGEHEDRTGFVSLADGPPVLDVVADPFESRVSVSQNGRAVLDVANAAARGLKVDPVWNTLPGGSGSLCTSILDRMPAADGSGG